ncbi:methionyl-tRNA formyltransferase [Marisediminicola sp. LYQ85]|uniref:methionyl-tRNA formyltransferase n=1 Tax=Marisediminicola sp. LYQ85 TaxID=3391062 RepID=UPI00398348D2
MRLVFAGSPAAAVPSLEALVASRHDVAAVVTRADSPRGRKRVLTPTEVADAAGRLGVPVIRTDRLDEDTTREIEELRPDLGVIVAYGGLVREPLLSTPRLGWINLHFSLLPRWRGAAPVQRAIMAGDDLTGATVFHLVPELDAGDIYGSLTAPIGAHETAGHLLDSLAVDGAHLLTRVVDLLASGDARPEEQRGDVTLAPKLTLDDARIDWARPAREVFDRIRGVTPEPGAFTELVDARLGTVKLGVAEAALARDAAALEPGRFALVGRAVLVGTATHPLELVRVHPAGKRVMAAADWWRGRGSDIPEVAS